MCLCVWRSARAHHENSLYLTEIDRCTCICDYVFLWLCTCTLLTQTRGTEGHKSQKWQDDTLVRGFSFKRYKAGRLQQETLRVTVWRSLLWGMEIGNGVKLKTSVSVMCLNAFFWPDLFPLQRSDIAFAPRLKINKSFTSGDALQFSQPLVGPPPDLLWPDSQFPPFTLRPSYLPFSRSPGGQEWIPSALSASLPGHFQPPHQKILSIHRENISSVEREGGKEVVTRDQRRNTRDYI